MTTSHKITAAALALCLLILVAVGYGWTKEHIEAAVLSAQQKADAEAAVQIADAEARNQETLKATLADYAVQRQAVQTPAQVVRAIPQVINLPAPVVQITEAQAKAANTALPNAPPLTGGDLILPAASAKAFYDAQLDCKVGAAKLDACTVTTANQKETLDLKDKEIGQLNIAVKGGTKWQRTMRALKFIGIGVAIGAGAAAVAMK